MQSSARSAAAMRDPGVQPNAIVAAAERDDLREDRRRVAGQVRWDDQAARAAIPG